MAKSLIPLFSVTSQVDTLVFCAYFEKSLYYIGKMERVIRRQDYKGSSVFINDNCMCASTKREAHRLCERNSRIWEGKRRLKGRGIHDTPMKIIQFIPLLKSEILREGYTK